MIETCAKCSHLGSYETDFSERAIDAMIVGAEKAGTTSLLRYLSQHPDILGHAQLEMLYFMRDNPYALGYDQVFSSYYPDGVAPDQTLLAKAVAVMYMGESMRRLYHHNSMCKLIAVLRDPADRAYSAYWWLRRIGWEAAPLFEEALAAEDCHSATGDSHVLHPSYVDRGRYDEQLRAVFDLFGREQVLVLRFEDLKQAPVEVCRQVFRFLELEAIEISAKQVHNRGTTLRYACLARALRRVQQAAGALKNWDPIRHMNSPLPLGKFIDIVRQANSTDDEPPAMSTDTRRALCDEFRPHIEAIESMLAQDLSSWKTP